MSKKDPPNLLDSLLDESARAEPPRREGPAFGDVAALTGLTDPDLVAVLGKVAPDDLLVVFATAPAALQRRILGVLTAESAQWVRENLAHLDGVHDAARDASAAKILKVARELLARGEIARPQVESIGAEGAPDAEEKMLRDLLTDLVRIGARDGADVHGVLGELLARSGEPLLERGLRHVAARLDEAALRAAIAADRAELTARYEARLRMMEQALLAIAAGESAEVFRARTFEKP